MAVVGDLLGVAEPGVLPRRQMADGGVRRRPRSEGLAQVVAEGRDHDERCRRRRRGDAVELAAQLDAQVAPPKGVVEELPRRFPGGLEIGHVQQTEGEAAAEARPAGELVGWVEVVVLEEHRDQIGAQAIAHVGDDAGEAAAVDSLDAGVGDDDRRPQIGQPASEQRRDGVVLADAGAEHVRVADEGDQAGVGRGAARCRSAQTELVDDDLVATARQAATLGRETGGGDENADVGNRLHIVAQQQNAGDLRLERGEEEGGGDGRERAAPARQRDGRRPAQPEQRGDEEQHRRGGRRRDGLADDAVERGAGELNQRQQQRAPGDDLDDRACVRLGALS